jgi:hypothetical protein
MKLKSQQKVHKIYKISSFFVIFNKFLLNFVFDYFSGNFQKKNKIHIFGEEAKTLFSMRKTKKLVILIFLNFVNVHKWSKASFEPETSVS